MVVPIEAPEPRAIHSPISLRVESVSELPIFRELPQDTIVPVNLRGDRKAGKEIIEAIAKQLLGSQAAGAEVMELIEILLAERQEIDYLDFFAIAITGVK